MCDTSGRSVNGMFYGSDSRLQTLGSYSDVILAKQETYRSGEVQCRKEPEDDLPVADSRSHKALAVENNQQ